MKNYIYITFSFFIILSCKAKSNKTINAHQVPQKDTILGDDFINEQYEGKVVLQILDKFSKEKTDFNYGDTFDVDIKYVGNLKKLRAHYTIEILKTSENLKLLDQNNKGRFKFYIKEYPKKDTITFESIILSDKYLFKQIRPTGKNKFEDVYTDNFGLGLTFITDIGPVKKVN